MAHQKTLANLTVAQLHGLKKRLINGWNPEYRNVKWLKISPKNKNFFYWSHLEEEENVIEEELDNFYEAGILKKGTEVDFGPP